MEYNHESHQYFHNGKEYISVTKMMQQVGATQPVPEGIELIEKARVHGQLMHRMLQNSMTNPFFDINELSDEEKLYYQFFATEYAWEDKLPEVIVFSEDLEIAGTADVIVLKDAEPVKIVDHKFTSTFKDAHLWQACIYAILSGAKEAEVINYKLNKVYIANDSHFEMAQKIINAYSAGQKIDLHVAIPEDLEKKYALLSKEIAEKQAELDEIKAAIIEEIGENKAEGNYLQIIFKKESVRKSLNKSKIEKDFFKSLTEDEKDEYFSKSTIKSNYAFKIKEQLC